MQSSRWPKKKGPSRRRVRETLGPIILSSSTAPFSQRGTSASTRGKKESKISCFKQKEGEQRKKTERPGGFSNHRFHQRTLLVKKRSRGGGNRGRRGKNRRKDGGGCLGACPGPGKSGTGEEEKEGKRRNHSNRALPPTLLHEPAKGKERTRCTSPSRLLL